MIELPIEKYALVWFLVFTRGLRKTFVSNLIQYAFNHLARSVYTNLTQKWPQRLIARTFTNY